VILVGLNDPEYAVDWSVATFELENDTLTQAVPAVRLVNV